MELMDDKDIDVLDLLIDFLYLQIVLSFSSLFVI